jgi:AmmeMemoRadiSam system protein B
MDVRPSPIAGRWYPGEPAALARAVDRYLAGARPEVPPEAIRGLVAPHAGLRYSGPVAAWAFACLRARPDRTDQANDAPGSASAGGAARPLVALVGPMHYPARAGLLTSAHDAYATPLGHVVVDSDAAGALDRALRDRLGRGLVAVRDDDEHALEIELPFLQRALGQFRLLPVMMRDQRAATAEALGEALAEALRGRPALLVASSDLSHYYPQAAAEKLDAALLDRLAAFDPAGVLAQATRVERGACGGAAIAAVLWAAIALGAAHARVLRYATSGDTSGDFEQVVGYAAAAIW